MCGVYLADPGERLARTRPSAMWQSPSPASNEELSGPAHPRLGSLACAETLSMARWLTVASHDTCLIDYERNP